MRKVTKGNVTIKLWDLGGQPRFRSMWERYCRAVSAIVYVPSLFPLYKIYLPHLTILMFSLVHLFTNYWDILMCMHLPFASSLFPLEEMYLPHWTILMLSLVHFYTNYLDVLLCRHHCIFLFSLDKMYVRHLIIIVLFQVNFCSSYMDMQVDILIYVSYL